jgi:hypothetical protein
LCIINIVPIFYWPILFAHLSRGGKLMTTSPSHLKAQRINERIVKLFLNHVFWYHGLLEGIIFNHGLHFKPSLSNGPSPPRWNNRNYKVEGLWWSPWKLKIMRILRLVMVEGNHEGDDEDSLFEHKHHKIWQTLSHTSKAMAIDNLKTLTPWFCWIQNGLQPKHHA